MSISAQTVFELRPSNGVDTSGGGFVAGSGGTDWSQQNSPHGNGTNLTVDGTTNTKVNPDGYTVATTDVGNIIQITTTGTGAAFTVGFYQITAATTGTTSTQRWTLDHSPAAVSSAGATWAMGGAIKTLSKLNSAMVGGNAAFIKAEATIVLSSGVSFAQTLAGLQTRIRGYTTTRGDNGYATVQLSGSTLTALAFTGAGWDVANFIVDCNSQTSSQGISISGSKSRIYNCTIKNFTGYGLNVAASFLSVYNVEITAGTSAATAAILSGNCYESVIIGCYVHDNACPGIYLDSASFQPAVIGNLITNNSGASSDGILTIAPNAVIIGNTIYKSGRHGINFNIAAITSPVVLNNIITDSGGWGIVGASGAGEFASPFFDGNAYYNNTSGNREFLDDAGTTNAISGVAGLTYTNVFDVALTVGTPFNNPSGNDFTLNNLPSQGALVRGKGVPQTILNATGTSHPDFGAWQAINSLYIPVGEM